MAAQLREADTVAEDILATLSATVMIVGPMLDQVYRTSDDFEGWVLEHLPIQPRTAERMRAMWLVWHEHPSDDLPEAWKALWSLD